MTRQAGFSLLEMTVVLAIVAIGATTAIQIAHTKMEERITSRTVSDLSIAVEAAYECFVARVCAIEDPKSWVFSGDWKNIYLPNPFPDKYSFSADGSKATIRVDMGDPARAKRAARAFGSSARVAGRGVVVDIRTPGTESALSSLVQGIEDGGVLDEITIGSETITEESAIILVAIANGLSCEHGYIKNESGETVCALITCRHNGETLDVGEVRDISSWGRCVGKTSASGPSRYCAGGYVFEGGRDGRGTYCRSWAWREGSPARAGRSYRSGHRCNSNGDVVFARISSRSC